MTPAGRKPKPAAQRQREGNPGRRRIREGAAIEGVPVPPLMLGEHAREEWERVVPELVRLGLAGTLATGPLVAMCVQWGVAEDARAVIEREGLVEEGSMGQMVEHPLLTTYRSAIMVYLRIATEFGMTASAAMRVSGSQHLPAGSPLRGPFDAIGDSPRLRALKGGRAS